MLVSEHSKENVVLFPKAVEYYQMELTRMLESDRFGEAAELLRFLLQCEFDDAGAAGEWRSLLDWLETNMPDIVTVAGSGADEEIDEAEMFRMHVEAKTQEDDQYTERLLHKLQQRDSAPQERQLSLAHLSVIDDPRIAPALAAWAEQTPMSPLLQFRVLQTLRKRGMTGTISVPKQDGMLPIALEDVPLSLEQYPANFRGILERVQQVGEREDPTLPMFAAQLWEEYGAYVYGTPEYTHMLGLEADGANAWSAALHLALEGTLGGMRRPDEIAELYGVTDDDRGEMVRAARSLRDYMQAIRPTDFG